MNWRKEAIDQPLHALWAFVTVLLFFAGVGLAAAWSPLLICAGGVSLVVLCGREIWQKRHHDGGILANWPWLDTCGYVTGAVLGTVAGVIWL